MGNFEKLSVVVIVVIIVMILAVAVVEWTSGPSEVQPAGDQANAAAVIDPPKAEEPKPKPKPRDSKALDKKDPVFPRDPLVEADWNFPDDPFKDSSKTDGKKGPESEKSAKSEPVAPPAPTTTPDIPETTHVVASGETLGAISKKYYDRVSLWTVIVEANPGLKPESMRPGQTLKIPAKKGVPLVIPGNADAPSGPGAKPVPGKEYTVRPNDTWERISSAAYNTSARWPEIYLKNLNRVKDQKDLPPGKTIMIPK